MIMAFIVLLLFKLAGDWIQNYFAIPIPGSLIGMSLFTVFLYFKPRAASRDVRRTSRFFTTQMGLFFVPAGVGVIAQIQRIRLEWLPITAALVLSTLLSLVVSALMMQWACAKPTESETGTQLGETE